MKKIILLAALSMFFIGCGKDDESEKTITNLSGETWYETWVWFAETLEHDELAGFDDRGGTVEVGKSYNVKSKWDYFYVSFKDESGEKKMSKTQKFVGGSATVTKQDLH
jgi:hypothetical protein